MKSKLKKVLIISATSFVSMGTIVSGVAIANKGEDANAIANNDGNGSVNLNASISNDNFDPDKPLVFEGIKFPNLYAAIKWYTNQPGNVNEQLFLGNISKATINENNNMEGYTLIDLNKLKPYDSTKLSKAYKTASDNYTSSLEEAKKSYLRDPIFAYTDNNGMLFDTESEAEDFIKKDINTAPVAYYEIDDHSNLNVLGKPSKVNINPLNKNDVVALKKLAIKNMFIKDSGFELKRLEAEQDKDIYQEKDFKGKSQQEIQKTLSEILDGFTDIIKDNMWLNVEVNPTLDNRLIENSEMEQGPSFGGGIGWKPTPSSFEGRYEAKFEENSALTGTNFKDISDDAKLLLDKDKMLEIMELKNAGRSDRAKNAILKKNKTLFGHSEASFTFPDHERIQGGDQPNHLKKSEAISFNGRGSYRNVYFSLNVNQNKFDEYYNSHYGEWNKKAEETVNKALKFLKDKFVEHKFSTFMTDILLKNLQKPLLDIMTSKVVGNREVAVDSARDSSVFLTQLNKMNGIVLDAVNKKLTDKSMKTLDRFIEESLNDSYLSDESKDSSRNIYAVTYNGHELFKIENDLFSGLYGSVSFRTNPLQEVKKYINDLLAKNYTENINKILDSMTNVSNSFNKETNPSNKIVKTDLSRTAIDKYSDEKNKVNMFGFATHNSLGSSGFDSKYKSMFIDTNYKSYGISDTEFKKNFNVTAGDNQALLNSQLGTFEAVQQYNRHLEKILKDQKNPTSIQKKQLEKNAVTDLNNIVSLFEKNGTPKQIKYSEYFDSSYKFNESLSNGEIKLITSKEQKDKYIENNKLNKPTKVVVVKDLDGNVVNFNAVSGGAYEGDVIEGDGYATSKEQAMINAMNKVDVKEDLSKIYYTNDDGTLELIDNTTTKLNVLKVTTNTTIQHYGFLTYNDMYNYISQYIRLNSTGNGSAPVNPAVVPFDANNIDYPIIKRELSGVENLDEINNLEDDIKFDKFGDAFHIKDFNEWNMYIKQLKFSSVKSKGEFKKAEMLVQLKDGFTFKDGKTYIKVVIEYETSDLIIGPSVNQSKLRAATISSVTSSILAIVILEAILITTLLINKRNKESEVEKKLMRLVKK